ncbi:tape measure protein [Fusibacter bizertensis]
MATIQNAMQITDGVSSQYRMINKTINMVSSSFEQLKLASTNAINVAGMRVARQEISITEKQFINLDVAIQQTQTSQQNFNKEVEKSKDIMGAVKNIAGSITKSIDVKKILDTSDALSTSKTRLDAVNDGFQTTTQLQDMVYASAQRSRSAYLETADTVATLGTTAKDSFGSNAEMIQFAELMNKQFKLGGASVLEQASAMDQLMQAMANGKLEGGGLISVMENAPMLAQSIADYMGKSVGELKEMASEGQITSDVIKNAMFTSAEETNAKFSELPMTFAQLWTEISNGALKLVQPLLLGLGQAATFVHDNWATITPILMGVGAAIGVITLAYGLQTAATWLNVAANRELFTTMLSNPITLIAIAIGVLVGVIYNWITSVGGLKIAWLIAVNTILTAFDNLKISVMSLVAGVLNAWDNITIATAMFSVGLANHIGDMKVDVLGIVESMVNGAIGLINGFIEMLNKIPGVSIEAVQTVSFAADAAAQNEAEKQARNRALDAYTSDKEANIAAREKNLAEVKLNAEKNRTDRENQIKNLQDLKAQEKNPPEVIPGAAFNEVIEPLEENTSDIKDAVNLSSEDLKYMRDLAEQDVINRFTTAEIKVDMTNSFGDIHETADLDGVVAYLEDSLTESLNIAAEGAPIDV